MILLTVQTDHFFFQALGADGDQAGAALNAALDYHASMYRLPKNWHTAFDVERLEIEPGECFRDGQLLYRSEGKPS